MSATAFPIRRNTLLLAAALASLSGMLQLSVAVATITLVLVTGVESILGLGPAIFLAAGALAALPAGRAMDRFGRIPVLAGGFVTGIVAAVVVALGCLWVSPGLVVLGLALVGTATGTILLARAAAADMYPPERRARGISLVLFGAVFGAALGPLVFRPLFAGKHLDTDALVVPWLAGGGIMAVGLVLTIAVRPDPKRIGRALGYGVEPVGGAAVEAEPLVEILRRPGVLPALVAAVASFAVMVAVMNLTGYMVVGHGHSQADTFWVISAHIVGMYGLVLVVGDLIDRLGRRFALVGGLVVMAASCLVLVWVESVAAMSAALFGLGLGWVFSYVAATSELVDLAALSERGRLVGLSDLLSGLTGATLALVGGAVYSGLGASAVAVGATVVVAAPAFLLAVARRTARLSPRAGRIATGRFFAGAPGTVADAACGIAGTSLESGSLGDHDQEERVLVGSGRRASPAPWTPPWPPRRMRRGRAGAARARASAPAPGAVLPRLSGEESSPFACCRCVSGGRRIAPVSEAKASPCEFC